MTKHWWVAVSVAMGLGLASNAHAVGFGTTAGFGVDSFGGGPLDVGLGFGFGFAPSLDLYFEPVVLQIHVLETLDLAVDDTLFAGANVYVGVHEGDIGGGWQGVVQPGGSLDLFLDPVVMSLAGECRFGIQAANAMGFGIYVVPGLGVIAGDGDGELYAGGALQISAWITGNGGSGSSASFEEPPAW